MSVHISYVVSLLEYLIWKELHQLLGEYFPWLQSLASLSCSGKETKPFFRSLPMLTFRRGSGVDRYLGAINLSKPSFLFKHIFNCLPKSTWTIYAHWIFMFMHLQSLQVAKSWDINDDELSFKNNVSCLPLRHQNSLTSEEQKATFSYIFPFAKLRILVTPNPRRILWDNDTLLETRQT